MKVSENPSTGFRWIVDEASTNDLFTIEDEFIYPEVPAGFVGAPGYRLFTLNVKSRAPQNSEGKFRAVYERPWMFKGFDSNSFDESKYGERNLISIPVYVI